MKIHTTNYIDTFIEISEDCPVSKAEIPIQKKEPTVATIQYEIIAKHPYQFTSDELIFETFTLKNDIPENEKSEARKHFFSKGQACFRSSPLAKRYGFGFHYNSEEKVAIFPVESEEYQSFMDNKNLKKVKAMRSKRI